VKLLLEIAISDLKITRDDKKKKGLEETASQNSAKVIAQLMLSDKKKELLITQLVQAVANQNIQIQKLKGGN
jgi:hypothetical protein